jgi:hypothetical protein
MGIGSGLAMRREGKPRAGEWSRHGQCLRRRAVTACLDLEFPGLAIGGAVTLQPPWNPRELTLPSASERVSMLVFHS